MKQEKIYYLNIGDFKTSKEIILNSISEERKQKAIKYLQEDDRIRSYLGSYLLSRYVKGEIKYSSLKKPYSDECYFSLSHCQDYVLLYLSDRECGVDIEKRKVVDKKVIDYCLSNDEKSKLKNDGDFIYYWTRKEAFSKCIGQGMFNNLKIKEIPCIGDTFTYNGDEYSTHSFKQDDYVISISKKGEIYKDILFLKAEIK